MWTDEDLGRGGGGFDTSTFSPSASQSTEGKSSKKASSIVPVTCKQILTCTDDVMTIAGLPVSMMCVVGIVKSVEVTSTKISYTVQDWSGTIVGMQWIDQDEKNDEKRSAVIENTYCKMFGTKRVQNDQTVLFLYGIHPIEDLSELTHHYLQIIHIPFKAEQLSNLNQDKGEIGQYSDVNPSSSMMINGGGGADNNLSLTPLQMKVYRFLQQSNNESGVNKVEIYGALQKEMNKGDIEKAIDFLVTEGHIYNTIDDSHFRVTDG